MWSQRTITEQVQCAVRRLEPLARVVLDDHARLPGRFFGRLTAAVQAGLRG